MTLYRLVRGGHIEDTTDPCPACQGMGSNKERPTEKCHLCLGRKFKSVRYKQGAIFESPLNLAQVWPEKFEVADPGGVAAAHPLARKSNETSEQYAARLEQVAKEARSESNLTISDSTKGSHSDAFESMSVADLKAFAASEEVDLRGASKKEDIIKVLRSAPVGAS